MEQFSYDEKIRRFKDLASQYHGMKSQIQGLKLEIQKINDRMIGYRSPTWDKIGSTPTRHEPDIIGMIQAKARYEQQIHEIEGRCAWIVKCIRNIDSPYNRSIASLLYLDDYTLNDVAVQYQISEKHVYETTKEALGDALTEDLMLEYLALMGPDDAVIG